MVNASKCFIDVILLNKQILIFKTYKVENQYPLLSCEVLHKVVKLAAVACEFTVLSHAGCNICLIRLREIHDGRSNERTHGWKFLSRALFRSVVSTWFI